MKIKAFAKINLTLDITGRREDGYHLIDSVMQSVSLFDEISILKSDGISVKCSVKELSGEGNIAHLAACRFFEAVKIRGGAEIYIEKNIPYPAGLGGGSADAAAVIMGLDRLYHTNLKPEKLLEIGLSVGADVPFCMVGGTARAEGIGEVITPIKSLDNLYILLAQNGKKTSTRDMYEKIDGLSTDVRFYTPQFVNSINSDNRADFSCIGNIFASCTLLYGIDKILEPTLPLAVSLSGSGPTVFAIYSSFSDAYKAKELLEEQDIWCCLCEESKSGIIIE